MRSEKIEEMKVLTAEALRKQGLTIENGTIRSAGITEINGLAVVTATIDTADGGICSLGNLTAGQFMRCDKTIRGTRYGFEALLWLMAVAGVDRSEDLGGQYIRVAFNEDGMAQCIGHIVKDTWLDFKMLAEGIREEDFKEGK